MSTMALFTTMPASEMMPTPVMMMPKGMRNTISPSSTPTVDMITEVRMMKGLTSELNCEMRMKPMRKSAIRNAVVRKAWASACSSFSPV